MQSGWKRLIVVLLAGLGVIAGDELGAVFYIIIWLAGQGHRARIFFFLSLYLPLSLLVLSGSRASTERKVIAEFAIFSCPARWRSNFLSGWSVLPRFSRNEWLDSTGRI